jgi:hypothetical protein
VHEAARSLPLPVAKSLPFRMGQPVHEAAREVTEEEAAEQRQEEAAAAEMQQQEDAGAVVAKTSRFSVERTSPARCRASCKL